LKVAIDSSQTSGSIAIHDGARLLYSAYFDIRITHSETLMPTLDRALSYCNLKPKDISELYVCSGPGSFTGLRIGIATAKGIAYALAIPVYSYNSLQMAALACLPYQGKILSVIDAKMKECYAALYDESLKEITAPCVLSASDILSWPLQGSIVCGNAASSFAPYAEQSGFRIAPSWHNISRADMLFYMAEHFEPTVHKAGDLADLQPLYLRESTAQIKASKLRNSRKQENQ